jgi:hypothetical protein
MPWKHPEGNGRRDDGKFSRIVASFLFLFVHSICVPRSSTPLQVLYSNKKALFQISHPLVNKPIMDFHFLLKQTWLVLLVEEGEARRVADASTFCPAPYGTESGWTPHFCTYCCYSKHTSRSNPVQWYFWFGLGQPIRAFANYDSATDGEQEQVYRRI